MCTVESFGNAGIRRKSVNISMYWVAAGTREGGDDTDVSVCPAVARASHLRVSAGSRTFIGAVG